MLAYLRHEKSDDVCHHYRIDTSTHEVVFEEWPDVNH